MQKLHASQTHVASMATLKVPVRLAQQSHLGDRQEVCAFPHQERSALNVFVASCAKGASTMEFSTRLTRVLGIHDPVDFLISFSAPRTCKQFHEA
jgi:hypothetical protein